MHPAEPLWTFQIDERGLELRRGGQPYTGYYAGYGGPRPSAVQMARFVSELGADIMEQPGLTQEEAASFIRMASEFFQRVLAAF